MLRSALIPAFLLLTVTAQADEPVANPPAGPVSAETEAPHKTGELIRKIRPSVVSISPDGREGTPAGIGTGFIISPDGLIVTSMHVIGEGRRLSVEMSDGTAAEVTEVVAWDRDADLAIIRIAGHDLPSLPLAGDDPPEQGTGIIVIGNPRGLKHSVVEGVLSAVRPVEGREMLQLAIPIEPGNSGGPVVDFSGRVLGVVALKSAVTENLGFAVPVSAVRKLKESPAPVAMKHWLTIGALNPKRWEPQGCEWTQRAGSIRSRGTGPGFGGRALCLQTAEAPQIPYEISVRVRLGDEAGAAGLAFCADGGDRHYGFYPTAGGLRLTRFEGPDVFSWTILEQFTSPHYQSGQWNHLRVRVEADRLICWLNGEQVVTSTDTGLRAGRAGLCSFRGTEADFREFRTGSDLSAEHGGSEELRGVIKALGAGEYLSIERAGTLAGEPEAARVLAEREARALEKRAADLRRTAREAHEAGVTAEIKDRLSRPEAEIPLAECALLIARIENPDIDPAATLEELDRMGTELAAALTEDERTSPERALVRLNRWMFQENGFHGSEEEMTNPANSRLNEVIDDREGIPLTLAIVHMELASRIGLKVVGIPFPGYFMTQHRNGKNDEPGSYIDVFSRGKILNRDQARERVYEMFGALPPDETHQPASKRSMILRMLANLSAWSVERQEPERALRWLNVNLAIDADDVRARLQRVFILAAQGRKSEAGADVQEILRLQPADLDLEKLRELLNELEGGQR